MKTLLIAALALAALGGCASDSALRAQIAGANIELARHRAEAAAQPVLNARIPTPHGDMLIVVHAPSGGAHDNIAMPDDPAWRVADRLVGVAGTGLGLWLGGEAAVGITRATAQGIVGALKAQPAPTVVTQPAPLVVPAPDPLVVTQPAPIIVEQPAPIIVNPVVVPAAP